MQIAGGRHRPRGNFFRRTRAARIYALRAASGIDPQIEVIDSGNQPFAGKTFVFTGTMEQLGRKEAQTLAESLGARAAGSVSKKTDYLVAGENAGSKRVKAEQLGIDIITEQEFLQLVEDNTQ